MTNNTRIAVGILVDEDTLPLLSKTVVSVRTISDHIFVLAVGENVDVTESNVTVHHSDLIHDEAAARNSLIEHIEKTNVADFLVWLNPGEEFDKKTLDEFQYFLENECRRDFLYVMVTHRLFREDRIRHDFDEETIDARLMPLRKGIRFQGQLRASLISRSASLMTQISAAPGRILLPSKQNDPTITAKRATLTLETLEKLEKSGETI